MPFVLLKPHVLALKNSLLTSFRHGTYWRKHLPFLLIACLILYIIFLSLHDSLLAIQEEENFSMAVAHKLVDIAVLAIFLLLLLSNIVASMGWFFCARDLPLLLTLPISPARFYLSRVIVTSFSASWVLLLLSIPLITATYVALDLPATFLAASALVGIPMFIIPTTFASLIVTTVINIFPVRRLQAFILLVPLAVFLGMLSMEKELSLDLTAKKYSPQDTLEFLHSIDNPNPIWLPSHWAAKIINSTIISEQSANGILPYSLLLGFTTAASLVLGYAVFKALFARGWTESLGERRAYLKSYAWPGLEATSRIAPLNPQLRAIMVKEYRMFLRDPTQCVQLCLLLLLSIVYLYNLRTLRSVTIENAEAFSWWQTMLCISNVALGASVISAICARFVFPSISLEGQSYWIVRSAPISIRQLIINKFLIWLFPISIIAMVLLISGAFATQVPAPTVAVCLILSISLSIGIVGLTAGLGGVYAIFDWDSPTQAAASFGSIVAMLLAVALIVVTLIPASLVIIITAIPDLSKGMSTSNYITSIACAMFLSFFLNLITARWAIDVGEQALRRREK